MTDISMLVLRTALIDSGIIPVIIGELNAESDEGVAIRPVDGYPSTRYFGQEAINEPLVEVVIRANSYSTGEDWYQRSRKALDQFSQPENGVLSCFITGSPGYLGKSPEGQNEWHLMVHVTVQD